MATNSSPDTSRVSNNVENVPLNRWFHLTIVIDDQTSDVYIDGKLYKSVGLSSPMKQNNGDLFVTQGGGFEGGLTQLRYYNKALTARDVAKVYYQGPSPWQLPNIGKWFRKADSELKFKFDVDGKEYGVASGIKALGDYGYDEMTKGWDYVDKNIKSGSKYAHKEFDKGLNFVSDHK